jgi:type I restriction enzyme, S subunit
MLMTNKWKTGKLGDLVTFKTGKLDSNAAVADGDYPFFTCSQETLRTNTFSFDTECVLLAGNNANGIFPLKYFHGKFDAYQRTYIVRPQNSAALNTKFLYYTLRPKLSEFRSFSTGAATKFLTMTILNETEIGVPPFPIQQRIAGILSAYDELIENSQRRIRILESMARALYREWFVHFRFPGHEKHPRITSPLGDIPKGWEVKPILSFGSVITGKTPSKNNSNFFGTNMPFLKTPDMHGNMFILSTSDSLSTAGAKSQANKTLPAGSICVSCIGTIGVVSITTEDCQTNQQINSVVLANSTNREFLFFRLQDAKQALENLGSNGATMGNVNKGKFESIEIVCPSDDLLARYHRVVEPIFMNILTLLRQIQNLRKTRDLLLPRLLSGQVELNTN